MLFNEPAPTGADVRFRIFGIPVRVHPFFWLIGLFMGMNLGDPLRLAAWLAAFFTSILIHELGHAAVLRAFGHRPWIILYAMGGLTAHQPGAYRARGAGTLGQIAVSAAGPGAGFLATVALALIFRALGNPVFVGHFYFVPVPIPLVPSPQLLGLFLFFFAQISIIWGVINLLPIHPLDGGHISREIFTAISPRKGIAISLALSALVAAAIAAYLVLHWGGPNSLFTVLLFGYLAYASFAAFEQYQSRRW